MAVALYPGSFDPVHNGHVSVVAVAARLFDEVVVAVGHNQAKTGGFFEPDERIALLEKVLAPHANVRVIGFSGLATVVAAEQGADCLVKGVRSSTDLDAEMLQANMNLQSSPDDLPTVFIPGIGSEAMVSSRYIREIATAGGDVSAVVPPIVLEAVAAKVAR